TCYLTNRPNIDLLGLDLLMKFELMNISINSICNQIYSSAGNQTLSKKTSEHL
ncbi:hypothetical protein EWB00_001098, partial [Schistosoma japonicum]